MSLLHLYDTKSRKTSQFNPIKKGEVGIYLCGATVQAPPHIGHIRSGVNFDILRRWLITSGYKVTFIRNVTDIDDKIIHKAGHEEITWWQVAAKYERAFTDAYNKLNVIPPTYEPRATGHITQMIALIEKLISNDLSIIIEHFFLTLLPMLVSSSPVNLEIVPAPEPIINYDLANWIGRKSAAEGETKPGSMLRLEKSSSIK